MRPARRARRDEAVAFEYSARGRPTQEGDEVGPRGVAVAVSAIGYTIGRCEVAGKVSTTRTPGSIAASVA